ncbi:MAG TPA: STAS/SEC14 domain-containing protein [Rhizomicrobium sp.]|nr:STAS/SEC14 domain-containing protein [Rhizomicrobium sp.]
MFQILSGFPDDVLAVSATGKVTAEDYDQVLVPAVEARMGQHRPLKLFFHFRAAI